MKIVKAAIVYQNKCFFGYNHEECFKELFNRYDREVIKAQDIEQGFLTDTNEFISREEAMYEAVESGQIRKTYIDEEETPPLASEDMYICWLHEKDKEIEQFKKFLQDNEWESIEYMQNTLNTCEEKYKNQCKEIERLKAHIADMEQEQIKIMKEHEEFAKNANETMRDYKYILALLLDAIFPSFEMSKEKQETTYLNTDEFILRKAKKLGYVDLDDNNNYELNEKGEKLIKELL